jgi:hypothetical protein
VSDVFKELATLLRFRAPRSPRVQQVEHSRREVLLDGRALRALPLPKHYRDTSFDQCLPMLSAEHRSWMYAVVLRVFFVCECVGGPP